MGRPLEFIDSFLAEGREEFTFDDARTARERSPTATANVLHRLEVDGFVDRLSRGRYAIRPLGSLNTSATTDALPLAVAATFGNRAHRIAYLSALSELGLLSHSVRTITVACTTQVRIPSISRRPLRVVIERPETIHIEAEPIGRSWCSTLERALVETAVRVDLLAHVFGSRGLAAERRLASLARALDLPLELAPSVGSRQKIIRLDPRDAKIAWVDDTFRVAWNVTADELRAVVGN